MLIAINSLFNNILNLFFPCQCLGCNIEGSWLCQNCKQLIHLQKNSICNDYQNEKPYFDSLLVAAHYEKGHLLQKTIKTFKYRFIKELKYFLGDLLSQTIQANLKDTHEYELIAVPLHISKKRWRGFNQAELLCEQVSQNLQIKIIRNSIKRIRKTKSQAELNRTKRLKNLDQAFICSDKQALVNKKIILIDDICTTGTTLNQCAKVLRVGGAKEIIALVIAKG